MYEHKSAKTRELLAAAKPFKHITKFQRYLSIGYDLNAGHLTMIHHGVNVEKLPPPVETHIIYKNKIVTTKTPKQKYVTWILD